MYRLQATGRPWYVGAFTLTLLVGAPTSGAAQGATGAVRGVVTERGSAAPLGGTLISVDGSRASTATAPDGRFVLRNLPAGAATLRYKHLGHQALVRVVQVPAGGEITIDIALERTTTTLDAVVTTATGDQSRRSFGNVVHTVNVDSAVSTASIGNINELLQARVPGVQVMLGAGQVGSYGTIRIRGTSSLSLTNEPLIIVDGVRIDNNYGAGNQVLVNNSAAINPEEIASIDVLKGPSASALYGTAAANGVLVIKTKRGQQGATRWNTTIEGGQIDQPAQFPTNYRAWGRTLTNGVPGAAAVQCKLADQSLGRCVRDSLTTFNPWMNADTRPFATSPRYQVGLNASGGGEQLTYFFAVEQVKETGPFHMPDIEVARLTASRGSAPTSEQVRPNALEQMSLRGNFTFPLGKTATLALSTGYSDKTTSNMLDGSIIAGLSQQMFFAPGFRNALNGNSAQYTGDVMSVTSSRRDQRFTGSTQLTWQPRSWLSGRAVVGLDQVAGNAYRFSRLNQGTVGGWGPPGQTGGKLSNRSSVSRYSVDLGMNADFALTSTLTSRTSVGAQWFKDTRFETIAQGYTLPPGVQTPNSATTRTSSEATIQNATYGAFMQQELAWKNRLFLTASVRTDQNSAFGRDAGNTIYPGLAASYVVTDEPWFPQIHGVNSLRVRVAHGQAGVQPSTTAALQFLSASTAPIGGVEVGVLRLTSVGNSLLKPEVTTETEAGFDLGLLGNRVQLEATYFGKLSRDALFNNALPPSYGAGANQWQNLAAVKNAGAELSIDAAVFTSRWLSWNTRLNGSRIENRLVSVGDARLTVAQGSRNVVGYPTFGLWARPILRVTDANNDGIVTEGEIVVGDTAVYRGTTLPKVEAGWSNTVGAFGDRVQLRTVLDYRGGFYNQWGFENSRCSAGNCRAVNDPTASLADQAAAVAATSASLGNTVWGFFSPNDYVAFRELSVSYQLPGALNRFVRARTGTVSLVGRNLGVVWTRFPGISPDNNSNVGNTGGGNNDLNTQPALRTWSVRFNLGF